MALYLLDTTILVRIADPKSEKQGLALQAVSRLLREGHALFLCAQVIAEFWSVVTRPIEVNGLGFEPTRVRAEIDRAREQFPVLHDTPDTFYRWLTLVTDHGISGKRVHDIKLLALMLEHNLTHLLTFNPRDFPVTKGITVVDPSRNLA
jgi:predicted nucleic acid-binding protein